jgi:hypothetical protein
LEIFRVGRKHLDGLCANGSGGPEQDDVTHGLGQER